MKIIDIVYRSAQLLNKTEIAELLKNKNLNLNSLSKSLRAEIINYSELANIVVTEIASSYIPLTKVEKVCPTLEGKIYYSELSLQPMKILKVLDANNKALKFTSDIEYLVTGKTAKRVEYQCLPVGLELLSEVGYLEHQIPTSILAFALSAEICLVESRFDEAVTWRNRFSDTLTAFLKPKNAKIKGRVWL